MRLDALKPGWSPAILARQHRQVETALDIAMARQLQNREARTLRRWVAANREQLTLSAPPERSGAQQCLGAHPAPAGGRPQGFRRAPTQDRTPRILYDPLYRRHGASARLECLRGSGLDN